VAKWIFFGIIFSPWQVGSLYPLPEGNGKGYLIEHDLAVVEKVILCRSALANGCGLPEVR